MIKKTRYHNQFGERNDHGDEFNEEIKQLEAEMDQL